MSAAATADRPRSVAVALVLLAASWTVGLIVVTRDVFVAPQLANGQSPFWAAVFLAAVVSIGLYAALFSGRRWAYLVCLVAFALVAASQAASLGSALARSPLYAAYVGAAAALNVTVVVLLLLRPSRQWYGVSPPPAGPRAADDGVTGSDPAADS